MGENHWSAAILKRALANDSAWHRLSEKEFAHLQTLLPKPPAHHPHYAFRFIDLFAGIGGIRRGFESVTDIFSCIDLTGHLRWPTG
ncbi:DNA cytosine methyltransferase [Escherichia coli]|uniref:DNA cytosine methyltransferase n=1 Tax=Escherichia coli TaxID=562 RepID=UPI000DEC9BCE